VAKSFADRSAAVRANGDHMIRALTTPKKPNRSVFRLCSLVR
jgi:hypothetical protein